MFLHCFLSQNRFMLAWQLSHVVDNRWLPLRIRVISFFLISSTVAWFKFGFSFLMILLGIRAFLFILFLWIRDLTRERSYQGKHTITVQRGLKWGLVWFLFREVWFFFRVFWTFFHLRMAPINTGMRRWPALGVDPIPAFQVPLLNTVVLLIRGVTATLAHQEMLKGVETYWVLLRGGLGLYFLVLQRLEYYESGFAISSRNFGSIFFFRTGFHGLHVCLGIVILITRRYRILKITIRRSHHFRLEFSLWYWHFVDVVWLFLFFWVYTWGGYINSLRLFSYTFTFLSFCRSINYCSLQFNFFLIFFYGNFFFLVLWKFLFSC